MQRREFLTTSLATGAAIATYSLANNANAETAAKPTNPATPAAATVTAGVPVAATGPFVQPPLSYSLGALAPFLKEEQMNYHFNKHHAGYFKKLNTLVEGKPEAKLSLEELILQSQGPIFNNAAQAWNHTFFWNSMSPNGGSNQTGLIAEALQRDFGGIEAFKKAFGEAAINLFGSGWVWLAADKDRKLQILPLPNADNPLKHKLTPLLTLDVWEHSYYIDYRNDRAGYVAGFWSKVNWDFATHNLATMAKT